MSATPHNDLTVAELQRLLTQVEPACLLVSPRILRRIIKSDCGLGGPGLQVPHRMSYVVARDRLPHFASADELGLEPGRELPPTLILLPQPDRQRLETRDRGRILLRYWRLLFHARVHVALHHARSGSDGFEKGGLRSRIQRIGLTEFHEATAVLRQENYLLLPGDAATAYEEFAAIFLEQRYFAPQLLPLYFPACSRWETIDAVFAQDVDAATLFAATRPEGAPDPASPPIPSLTDEKESLTPSAIEGGTSLSTLPLWTSDSPRAYRRLLQRADKAYARGNMVRAAIFRMRAVRLAPAGQANPTRAAAHREMERFSRRLQNALGYSDTIASDWRKALFALLEPASRGIWPSESRMLYDLQKACLDRERPVYAVDLVEWISSFGRRPIKRLLPFHDSVLLVKHLRTALHRLTVIRIEEPLRRRLSELLIDATHQAEHRLRQRLRPVVTAALDKVGLTPGNIAEEVARDKLVEELLDLVVEHGFLGMGDLRDAIARNRLKLPDLTDAETAVGWADGGGPPRPTGGPPPSAHPTSLLRFCEASLIAVGRGVKNFFFGDALIRANRQLAADLDGVYHRGEIYLRWLQRFSAAAFGTYVGRLFTLYIALPFGCSLAVLKVWDEVVEHIPGVALEDNEAAREAAKQLDPYAFLLLGLFFLALFHIGPFRRGLLWASVKTWHGLRWGFHDLPIWFLRLPWVEGILQSKPWLFLYQIILKPLLVAVLCSLAVYSIGRNISVSLAAGVGTLVAVSLLLNSRWGAYFEELAADNAIRTWQLIHADLVPGLIRWVIYLYRRLQEEVERLIYTVDEWLRFRPGDSQLSLLVKPVLGLLWFVVTYLFRVIFNLFVEPTFNPIKHFPTVTVTAKLLLPIYPELLRTFRAPIEPLLGKALGNTVAVTTIGLLPGFAGFLVWEFKENWRLYRANQWPTLRPESIGHHGETVLRLMRPGFHSGTLPKLYSRLRHGRGHSTRKQYEELHHLRERLRQFVERNLFAVLAGSKSWGNAVPLRVGDIPIATNRIRVEIAGPQVSVHVDFEEHGGWLLAGISCLAESPSSWLSRIGPEKRMVFRDALAGFYKLAGVDVVREQIQTQLPSGTGFELTREGLVVWPLAEKDGETVYDLENSPRKDALLYSATSIHWDKWVQSWQCDHEGKGHTALFPLRIRLLPDGEL